MLLLAGFAIGHADASKTTGSAAPSAGPQSSSSGHSATSAPASQPARHGLGTSFSEIDSHGNTYRVTLVKVIDPARPADSYNEPSAGKRLVGAVFRITTTGNAASDDANSNATLQGANGQTYQASYQSIHGYTNFNSGEFSVAAGQHQAGAVVFEVPGKLKITEVQWSADAFNGSAQTWYLGGG